MMGRSDLPFQIKVEHLLGGEMRLREYLSRNPYQPARKPQPTTKGFSRNIV